MMQWSSHSRSVFAHLSTTPPPTRPPTRSPAGMWKCSAAHIATRGLPAAWPMAAGSCPAARGGCSGRCSCSNASGTCARRSDSHCRGFTDAAGRQRGGGLRAAALRARDGFQGQVVGRGAQGDGCRAWVQGLGTGQGRGEFGGVGTGMRVGPAMLRAPSALGKTAFWDDRRASKNR
eukprot:356891-Chlamydomonas_euryale.AAC.10